MSAIPATPEELRTEASPFRLFQAINAYQLTEAIRSAIELDIFTAIAAGHTTPGALATQCRIAERGARILCEFVVGNEKRTRKVLDIAAGHGLFGIAILRANPKAEVTAVDWKNVLEVARENAKKFGVADRYKTLNGSIFDADIGTGYDLILIPNFLHHFDQPTIAPLVNKLHRALKPGGKVATLEFVPEEDRVSPA